MVMNALCTLSSRLIKECAVQSLVVVVFLHDAKRRTVMNWRGGRAEYSAARVTDKIQD
jgi:hypothetical protein